MTPLRRPIRPRIKWMVVTLLAVVAAALAALGAYLYIHNLQQEELRNSLIVNCKSNGNPLRTGLREEKEDELHVAEHPEEKILKALHLSRLQAIELAQPQIKKLEFDIHVRYKPINCQDAYTK